MKTYKEWFEKRREKIMQDFCDYLRFKSISTDASYKSEMSACADWVTKHLTERGIKVEQWETSVHPVLFAEHHASDSAPTILLYGHYDVQPADPIEEWTNDPFDPQIRDGNVYARGALDNKGQCFYVMTAVDAFLQLGAKEKLNIKIILEGEEECGSVGTEQVLKTKRERLSADHALIVDVNLPAAGTPGVTLGLRGMAALNVKVSNSHTDLHSGMLGGIALNPNRALVHALSKLWDDSGRVAVPGFYDKVEELSSQEKERYALEFDRKEFTRDFGITAFAQESGYSNAEMNAIRPTLEINGMGGGYQGEGVKTIIPASAMAKLSCRLVPGQDPGEIAKSVAEYIRSQLPKEMKVEVELHHGGPAFRADPQSAIVKYASDAMAKVYGKPCQLLLSGGSIPIVPKLLEASGSEGLAIGTGLGTDNIHAPDEHFALSRFEEGFYIIAEILSKIAEDA